MDGIDKKSLKKLSKLCNTVIKDHDDMHLDLVYEYMIELVKKCFCKKNKTSSFLTSKDEIDSHRVEKALRMATNTMYIP